MQFYMFQAWWGGLDPVSVKRINRTSISVKTTKTVSSFILKKKRKEKYWLSTRKWLRLDYKDDDPVLLVQGKYKNKMHNKY